MATIEVPLGVRPVYTGISLPEVAGTWLLGGMISVALFGTPALLREDINLTQSTGVLVDQVTTFARRSILLGSSAWDKSFVYSTLFISCFYFVVQLVLSYDLFISNYGELLLVSARFSLTLSRQLAHILQTRSVDAARHVLLQRSHQFAMSGA